MNILEIINKLDLEKLDQEEFLKPALRRNLFKKAGEFSLKAALTSAPFFLFAMPKIAKAQSSSSIVDVLQFALTLEYLEAEFYNEGLATSGLIPSSDLAVFQQIAKHENAHVTFLKNAITAAGSTPVDKPTFDFTAGGTYSDVMSNYQTYLAVSQAFEDTGVRAYKGQAGNLITDNETLTAALRIHSVEARHAAEVRRLRNKNGWITSNNTDIPGAEAVYAGEQNTSHTASTGTIDVASMSLPTLTPAISPDSLSESFDEPLDKASVLAIVDPFIV